MPLTVLRAGSYEVWCSCNFWQSATHYPQWSETIISHFWKSVQNYWQLIKLVTKFEAFDFENSYLTCVSDVCGMTPSVLIMPLLNWKAWGYCDGICDDHDDADEK
jgi:hypothetical protein